ncbi:MAG: SDR family NAD(P)-dependent oxidoreductase [Pseudomonadota bacterium]
MSAASDLSPSTLFGLSGKTALVTGGASGVGAMAAAGLVAAGAHVIIASRNGQACEEAAAALNAAGPGSAEGLSGDVSTKEGVEALADAVGLRAPRLSILVNNAGRSWGTALEAFPFAAWDRVMSLNVAGLFTLTQALLPNLTAAASQDDPARVVNVGSVMGEVPMGDGSYSYSASKAAVHHLTRILAKELAPRRITVNALAPGPFVSKMTAFATQNEATRERVGAQVPLGRVGQDADIAAALQYLCGRGGAYVTGAILPISGGINVETGPPIFAEAGQ